MAGCAALPGPQPHPGMDPHLGVYHGSFDSALSDDPADDLNHNPCNPAGDLPCLTHHEPLADILLELRRQPDGNVSLAFFRDRNGLDAGRSLDLLGAGCGTRLGPLKSLEQVGDGPHRHLVASFPLTVENRLCLGKLRPISQHRVRLELAEVPEQHVPRIRVVIDRNVRDANYLYVTEDGIRRRVKIDLDNTVQEDHRYRVCIEDDLGEYQRCVLTDREFRSFALPVPLPGGMGVNYTWWQELRPRLQRTQGRYAVEQYIGRFERVEQSGS